MNDRRHFLKHSTVISLSPMIPTFLASAAKAAEIKPEIDERILVVVQLDGGNDGINTVIPFKDENYQKNRPNLHLPEKELFKSGDDWAFHPRMRAMSDLFEEERLSVVHGVGYPNPNRSHFESMNIWHTASADRELQSLGNGWLGDAVSLQPLTHGPHALHIGEGELPLALRGRRCNASSLASWADLKLRIQDMDRESGSPSVPSGNNNDLTSFVTRSVGEAYLAADKLADMPQEDSSARYFGELGTRLKLISQTIKSGAKARIYYTSQDGYDTHAAQLNSHANLLAQLSASLKSFMDDMKRSELEDRVAVLVFSEFGRRVAENGSQGTDHGTAGPVFLLGKKLTARTFGEVSSLSDLEQGDLRFQINFRDIYGSVLTDWLNLPKPVVLQDYGKVKFFAT